MSDNLITINDIRRAGFCVNGARAWFQGRKLDFRTFLREGISEDTLAATGDPLAAAVIANKHKAEQRG